MLRSSSFYVEDKCCFSLWYNANGEDLGSLIILDGVTNIANYLGDRGNIWRKTSHTLSRGNRMVSKFQIVVISIVLKYSFLYVTIEYL